jgi:hypothetical protein
MDPSHPFKDASSVDRHPQCDGEVPLRCQQELHTQGFRGATTDQNKEDSNLPSVMIGAIDSISHRTAKLNNSGIGHDSILSAVTHKLNVSGHMLTRTFLFVLVCRTRLSV